MIHQLLQKHAITPSELLSIPMRGRSIPKIDLSVSNPEGGSKLADREELWRFVGRAYLREKTNLLWGGYLEKRSTYAESEDFQKDGEPRCIHLGIDFWAAAGTEVFAPLGGIIHSFQDNQGFSNYGPTLILQHTIGGETFHSLYGHLSRASIVGLEEGASVEAGQRIGWLGEGTENGEWPPHLHFQLIREMGDWHGDYPGVCTVGELEYYRENCFDAVGLVFG
jgi:hypothetical protein